MGTDCRAAMPKRQIQKKPMTRSQHRRLLELKHGCPKLKVERAEARLAFATAGVDKAKKAHDFRETDLELCKLKGDVLTLTVEYWNATKELLDLLPYEQKPSRNSPTPRRNSKTSRRNSTPRPNSPTPRRNSSIRKAYSQQSRPNSPEPKLPRSSSNGRLPKTISDMF